MQANLCLPSWDIKGPKTEAQPGYVPSWGRGQATSRPTHPVGKGMCLFLADPWARALSPGLTAPEGPSFSLNPPGQAPGWRGGGAIRIRAAVGEQSHGL